MNKVTKSTIDLTVLNQIKWSELDFDDTKLVEAESKYE